jgi:broad specificity phosphatase PhoE
MKRVYSVRHGQRADFFPAGMRPPIEYAYDSHLTELGHTQGKSMADYFVEHLIPPGETVRVVSSPYRRAIETASHLATNCGVPVHIHEDFGELLHTRDYSENVYPKLTIRLKDLAELEKEWGATLLIDEEPKFYPDFPEVEPECIERITKSLEAWLPLWPEQHIFVYSHLSISHGMAAAFGLER